MKPRITEWTVAVCLWLASAAFMVWWAVWLGRKIGGAR